MLCASHTRSLDTDKEKLSSNSDFNCIYCVPTGVSLECDGDSTFAIRHLSFLFSLSYNSLFKWVIILQEIINIWASGVNSNTSVCASSLLIFSSVRKTTDQSTYPASPFQQTETCLLGTRMAAYVSGQKVCTTKLRFSDSDALT